MTDLRETVSAAILRVMREDGLFSTGAFADAAIAAMQPAMDQLERQRDAALTALTSVLAACDTGRMVSRGAGGMTLEAQIQRSVLNGVPAWPIEKAREALAQIDAVEGEGR